MSNLFADLQWRGLAYQTTDPSIESLLNAGGQTAYIGFDPTAPSLHLGNFLQLANLRRLQQAGHRPIVLAGGSTGMIGDPGGKNAERQLLDAETLRANVEGVMPQLQKFLDFEGPNAAILVNNYDWTAPVSVLEFLREVGKHFTVNSLMARESIRARLEDPDKSISFTEFSYGLLQAFDYWHLYREYGCTLQMGGSDQWANIVGGVDLIRRKEGATVHAFCSPLVLKADGTKFGKSESGAIWLDANLLSPYAFYQSFIRSEDAMVVQYLKYFTFLSHDEINTLEVATKERPHLREAQRTLAYEVTKLVHGEDEAQRAIRASETLFTEAIGELDEKLLLDVFADAPSSTFAKSSLGELSIVDALVQLGLSPSKNAARTAIQQGGVALNNRRCEGIESVIQSTDLLHGQYAVLRRGKKEYALARFE